MYTGNRDQEDFISYLHRFLAKGTMEEKIYDRQVTKQSLAARVVDEQQIESHFTMNELAELYEFNDEPQSARPTPVVPEDRSDTSP